MNRDAAHTEGSSPSNTHDSSAMLPPLSPSDPRMGISPRLASSYVD
ncbi:hypothetical protein Gpo141_00013527, partial [Globisporangium polare]